MNDVHQLTRKSRLTLYSHLALRRTINERAPLYKL
jgi:hypothetical protein